MKRVVATREATVRAIGQRFCLDHHLASLRSHIGASATIITNGLSAHINHRDGSFCDCPACRRCRPLTMGCVSIHPNNTRHQPLASKYEQQHTRQLVRFMSTTSTPPSSDEENTFTFANVSDFHTIADETLEQIQDAVEQLLEDDQLEELNYASGVLTLTMPPHGTWVLNKQTPNRQIWWSSPLSGPRRYEYNGHVWVYTRAAHEKGHAAADEDDEDNSLGAALSQEIEQLFGLKLDLKV